VASPLNSKEPFSLFLLAVLAVIFVVAAPVFWQEVELRPSAVAFAPENEDLREYYSPVYRQVYGALRDGRAPGWDSTRLCGTALVGDPRTAMFQPLNVVFLLAPFPEAFAAHAFACLAVAGIAFVLFARSMGVGATAALFGGLCFAFSGAAAGAMSRPPLASALAWIPLVMWGAHALARRPRVDSIVFLGMAIAGLLLSGAFAVVGATVCMTGAYISVAALAARGKNAVSFSRAVGGFFVAVCLSCCVCAIQLLPVIRMAIGLDDWTMLTRSVMPAGTLPGGLWEAAAQIAAPNPASLPSLLHIGIVGAVLLPAALLQRRRLVDAWFYSIAAVGLTVLAVTYGPHFPNLLPPYAVMYPAMGCAAAACALGADRIMRKRTGPGREWYWLGSGIVLSCCLVVIIAGNTLTRGYVTAAAVLVMILLVVRRDVVRVVVGLMLCGLVWTNLVTASQNVFGHPFNAGSSGSVVDDRVGASELGEGRLVVAGSIRDDVPGTREGSWRADGFGALFSREEAAWWRALSGMDTPSGILHQSPDLNLLSAMSGSVVLAGDDLDLIGSELPWVSSSAGHWYALNDIAIPRAHWVTEVEWVDGIDDAISSIRERDDGVAHVVFVDLETGASSGITGLSDADEPGNANATASIQDVAPEHVVVTMRTPVRGVLVLADSYSADWRVAVDGVPATMLRVNGIFRGVVIPAGDHVVDFSYRPFALYVGGFVSISTLVLLLLWGVARLFR
jgi:hypothetical protein